MVTLEFAFTLPTVYGAVANHFPFSSSRCKAEKQKSSLARELDDLSERLDEAGGATAAQVELNKKREAELSKLRRDLEEAAIQHDSTLASLKKKHTDAVGEMSEQVDALNKMKQKIEKEKHAKRLQIDEVKGAQDSVANERASIEKQNKLLQGKLQGRKLEGSISGQCHA